MNLEQRDRNILWHPFTQEKIAHLPIPITKAKGSYIYSEDGSAYLDLISSWWVNLHGHAHPHIAQAIYKQACTLEHVLFAGFTHEPAVAFCEALSKLLPKYLSRFFFSDNGSTSIEVAIKMAYQYWANQGESQRTLFLCFEGGYHGDTLGSMAVGVKSGFHALFKPLLFSVIALPFPSTWINDHTINDKESQALEILENYLKIYSNKISALILEPLIQGAGGMRLCRPHFVKKVIELVKRHEILVIFDEIMTGFGRTGTHFAINQIDTMPDFLCLSKGITGGFLPLALTITTETVYQAFLSHDFTKAFAHGHSYTANPIACAAAMASLELLLNSQTSQSLENIHKAHQDGIAYLTTQCNSIKKARILGTIAAFDWNKACNLALNQELKKQFLKKKLLLRPLNNTIYLLPPYSITVSELNYSYESISYILQSFNK